MEVSTGACLLAVLGIWGKLLVPNHARRLAAERVIKTCARLRHIVGEIRRGCGN
jgi:hypothetical protein